MNCISFRDIHQYFFLLFKILCELYQEYFVCIKKELILFPFCKLFIFKCKRSVIYIQHKLFVGDLCVRDSINCCCKWGVFFILYIKNCNIIYLCTIYVFNSEGISYLEKIDLLRISLPVFLYIFLIYFKFSNFELLNSLFNKSSEF